MAKKSNAVVIPPPKNILNEPYHGWHIASSKSSLLKPDGEMLVDDKKLEICYSGLHVSKHIHNAISLITEFDFENNQRNLLCRVVSTGEYKIERHYELKNAIKICTTERTILWRRNCAELQTFVFSNYSQKVSEICSWLDLSLITSDFIKTNDAKLKIYAQHDFKNHKNKDKSNNMLSFGEMLELAGKANNKENTETKRTKDLREICQSAYRAYMHIMDCDDNMKNLLEYFGKLILRIRNFQNAMSKTGIFFNDEEKEQAFMQMESDIVKFLGPQNE